MNVFVSDVPDQPLFGTFQMTQSTNPSPDDVPVVWFGNTCSRRRFEVRNHAGELLASAEFVATQDECVKLCECWNMAHWPTALSPTIVDVPDGSPSLVESGGGEPAEVVDEPQVVHVVEEKQ